MDPSRAPSHYLLWANEVKNVLLRTRPVEMWARAVAANLTGPAAAVAWRAISENVSGEKAVKCSQGNCTKISEVLGKEGADMGMKEARVFTGGACQDSISKHHTARPVIDVGKMTTGQGTAF